MLRYIVEHPTEDAENRRTFKFLFIAYEIFAYEINAIFKRFVEDEELMDLRFSFFEHDLLTVHD